MAPEAGDFGRKTGVLIVTAGEGGLIVAIDAYLDSQ